MKYIQFYMSIVCLDNIDCVLKAKSDVEQDVWILRIVYLHKERSDAHKEHIDISFNKVEDADRAFELISSELGAIKFD